MLSSKDYIILRALKECPRCGYELHSLLPQVAQSTTYYRLHRLLAAGFLQRFREENSQGPVRLIFACTPKGKSILLEQAQQGSIWREEVQHHLLRLVQVRRNLRRLLSEDEFGSQTRIPFQ